MTNLSYWEYKTCLSNIDYAVVGSGIVGLNCALHLKNKFPKSKIIVLERGFLPQGASTKNAGFACFGSISEIISDLRSHSEDEVSDLVKKRYNGIQLLRKTLGDNNIDFQINGGHELFGEDASPFYRKCLDSIDEVNELLKPVFSKNPFRITQNSFRFKKIQKNYITHSFEGQIDTGKMMHSLLNKVRNLGVTILNSISVDEIVEKGSGVVVKTNQFEFHTKNLLIATNGFAAQFLGQEVRPARAQVLITKPIKNLHVQGTFHMDEGYYYFRNIDNRILLGGGRNLDFKGECTTNFGETQLIQNQLEKMLKEIILPRTNFEIEHRWSGIMGVGGQKHPIIRQLSNHVFCGVRMGGMGIAMGSIVGRELAELALQK